MRKWKVAASCRAGNAPEFGHKKLASIWKEVEPILCSPFFHLGQLVHPPLLCVRIYTLVWGVHRVEACFGRSRVSAHTVYDEVVSQVFVLDRAEIEGAEAPHPFELHEPVFYGIMNAVRVRIMSLSEVLALELSVHDRAPFAGCIQLWKRRRWDFHTTFPITLKGDPVPEAEGVKKSLLQELPFDGISDYVAALIALDRAREVEIAQRQLQETRDSLAQCDGSLAALSEIALN